MHLHASKVRHCKALV